MKLKYLIIIIVAVAAVLAAGVAWLTINMFNYEHIEDTNGTETSLVFYDTEDLITNQYSYGARNFCKRTNTSTECYTHTVNSGFNPVDIDDDLIEYEAELLTGIIILQETNVNFNQGITYVIDVTLVSGNMEVIIIDPDNNIVAEVTMNEVNSIDIPSTLSGAYTVILAGESAEFELTVQAEVH